MSVKIGNIRSTDRNINAGAPQGSVLGSYLFTMITDGISKDFVDTVGVGVTREHEETRLYDFDHFSVSTTKRISTKDPWQDCNIIPIGVSVEQT